MQFIRCATELAQNIPLAHVAVPAGFPSPAEDSMDKTIDLNKHFIKHPAATYFVRVTGDSLSGKGILSGDLVIVDTSYEPKDGQIIIACLNQEFAIKEFKKNGTHIILKSANPKYPDIFVKEHDEFEVFGVVTGVVRSL